jgi:hypothetical protein
MYADKMSKTLASMLVKCIIDPLYRLGLIIPVAIGDDGRQVTMYRINSRLEGVNFYISSVFAQVEVHDRRWKYKIKNKWSFHSSKINSLSWSFDGTYLASGDDMSTTLSSMLMKCLRPSHLC